MLRRLDDSTAKGLVQRLVQRARGIQGGADAVKEHLKAIKVGLIIVNAPPPAFVQVSFSFVCTSFVCTSFVFLSSPLVGPYCYERSPVPIHTPPHK